MPRPFRISRSIEIHCPAPRVFEFTGNLERWNEWSPYSQMDSDLRFEVSNPSSGVGATYTWNSKKIGIGSMLITEVTPHSQVKLQLSFEKPVRAAYIATFETEALSPTTTQFTWSMEGERPLIMVILGRLLRMDAQLEKQFDDGLLILKKLLETPTS